jgi:hypothetical protein
MKRTTQQKVSIDKLAPTRGLMDLSSYSGGEDISLYGYELSTLYDDIILLTMVDESEDGESVLRDGIYIPLNANTKAWRIGKVLIKGPNCISVKSGNHVMFPGDKGIPVKNMYVKGFGQVKTGYFINEERIFGVVELLHDDKKK